MKRFITLLCLLLCLQQSALIAQDFRLFIPGQEKQYYRDGNKIYSIEIKRTTLNSSGETITFKGLPMFDMFSNCYENRFFDIYNDGVSTIDVEGIKGYVIHSGYMAPLFLIQTNANVGESWPAYSYNNQTYMTATCNSIESMEVNGKSQLVMTIGFNGNYCDLKISQYDGIVSTPTFNRNLDLHWWAWIEASNSYVECVDRIFDEGILEKFNVPFGDMAADLEPGDELHIEEYEELATNNWTKKQIKSTFLEREFDPSINSYRLKFKDEILLTSLTNGQIEEMSYVDHSSQTIGKHMPDAEYTAEYPLSINRILMNPGKGEFITYSFFEDRLSFGKQATNPVFSDSWGCFLHNEENTCRHEYIEGLAGPYYSCNNPLRQERTLKYYKKGDEEWGDPFTFTVSTKQENLVTDLAISPNPVQAGQTIQLSGLPNNSNLTDLHLLDLHGRVIQTWKSPGTFIQSMSDIKPGVYYLLGLSNTSERFRSKLIVY